MRIKMTKTFLTAVLCLTGTLLTSPAWACEECNRAFGEELLKGERQNSLLAQELQAAMLNQAPLRAVSAAFSTGAAATPPRDFIEIIRRDAKLPLPPTSFVPQDTKPDVSVTIELGEGDAYLGQGVMFKGFTTNDRIPGPTLIVEEGQVVEFTVVNKGSVPHGASIHAAYTQTSKYLGKIPPGESRTMVFRATHPGVYMYHCAPGGHAIPMHVLFGQYGMMVVKPKKKYRLEQQMGKKPDVELYLLQHEWYASGKDAVSGDPMYVSFNGKVFRYVEEPVKARPGDYVRIYFLNVGPNLLSTFHIVGIIWDYAYWQGHPDNLFHGGQTVTAGPSDSWVIEFRVPPDEGAYLMLSHAVGSTDRGAIGLLVADRDAKTPLTVLADGPVYSEEEMNELRSKAKRTISPFEPGTPDVDPPVVYGPETKEVTVKIIGNSYWPKRVKVAKGTTVRWINEEVFAYMDGEYSGIHNAVAISGPEIFASPMLGHAESFDFNFTKVGDYQYLCTPHPYMRGEVSVYEPPAAKKSGAMTGLGGLFVLGLVLTGIRRFRASQVGNP
jgi:nitrite reductase (NO-forming)